MVAKKICIIGDFAVGKTSLVRRHVLDEFDFDYHATLGVNVYKYTAEIEAANGSALSVEQIIWDLEGGAEPSALQQTYLQGASGALIVGDIGRENAIQSLLSHAHIVADTLPGRPMLFALNKSDLLADGAAAPDEQPLLDAFGQGYMRTSAKTGAKVTELFNSLARRIIEVGA